MEKEMREDLWSLEAGWDERWFVFVGFTGFGNGLMMRGFWEKEGVEFERRGLAFLGGFIGIGYGVMLAEVDEMGKLKDL